MAEAHARERGIVVGAGIEERHGPSFPWPEPRSRGVITEVTDTDVLVRWQTGARLRYPLDRIGNGMHDLIRLERS